MAGEERGLAGRGSPIVGSETAACEEEAVCSQCGRAAVCGGRESGQCGTGSGRRWSRVFRFHLLNFVLLAPSSASWPNSGSRRVLCQRGGPGERERLAEEVIVGRGFLSEVTWGGCRSYSPLISLMSAHSHLAGAPYAVCRQQRRRMPPPPTCRLARPPSALGFTPAPTLVDKGGIQGSVQARQGAILLSVP